MCFSASASFGTTAVLSFIGCYSLLRVRNQNYSLLAAIPLLFAVQQASEGIVWLFFGHDNYHALAGAASYLFLFFSHILWPLWIPIALYKVERDKKRRRYLLSSLGAGGIIASYFLIYLLIYPVELQITCNHIAYNFGLSAWLYMPLGILYLCATVVPFFISSVRCTSIFGLALTGSYVITYLFYYEYLTSVWCFFAALLSVMIVALVSDH